MRKAKVVQITVEENAELLRQDLIQGEFNMETFIEDLQKATGLVFRSNGVNNINGFVTAIPSDEGMRVYIYTYKQPQAVRYNALQSLKPVQLSPIEPPEFSKKTDLAKAVNILEYNKKDAKTNDENAKDNKKTKRVS